VTELWHVSENPSIEVFHPQQNELHALDEPLVWAVDSHYQWLYWFPRDCPRACWEANEATTEADVERWLEGDPERRVAVIEAAWFERMRSANVYAYRVPPDTFEPWDKFFASRETVVPLERVAFGDLLERHAEEGHELRIAPTLYPLWERVIQTTLDFSGIRLRNAARP
jgi:hypothetical protein